MKKATIYKHSRVEIENNISELEKLVSELDEKENRLTDFDEFCLVSWIKSIRKQKRWLEETNDEWLYIFKDVVVNNQLPEFMKF